MNMSAEWEAGINVELKNAAARISQRIKHADPWYRALTSCMTAQQIREKRTRNQSRRAPKRVHQKPVDRDTALIQARHSARQKALQQMSKGSWDYALKVKLTAWRTKAKEQADDMSFDHPPLFG